MKEVEFQRSHPTKEFTIPGLGEYIDTINNILLESGFSTIAENAPGRSNTGYIAILVNAHRMHIPDILSSEKNVKYNKDALRSIQLIRTLQDQRSTNHLVDALVEAIQIKGSKNIDEIRKQRFHQIMSLRYGLEYPEQNGISLRKISKLSKPHISSDRVSKIEFKTLTYIRATNFNSDNPLYLFNHPDQIGLNNSFIF